MISIILVLIICIQLASSQTVVFNTTYVNCSSIYCTSCLTPFICSTCQTTIQPSCCPKYCLTCLSMTHCIQCQPLFTLQSYNNTYVICSRISLLTDPHYNSTSIRQNQCSGGYYPLNTTNTCESCDILNCQFCNSYHICQMCKNSYVKTITTPYEDSNGQQSNSYIIGCGTCIQNCLICTVAGNCTQCNSGYYENQDQCLQCPSDNCLTCPHNSCSSCFSGYYLSENLQCQVCSQANGLPEGCFQCSLNDDNGTWSTTPQCTTCQAYEYYSPSPNNCAPCPANCNYCPSGTCYVCNKFYVLSMAVTSCILCGEGCSLCGITVNNANLINCSQCITGYLLVKQANSSISFCSQCPFPCTSCLFNGQLLCGQCQTGFYLNLETKQQFELYQCYLCNIPNCLSCNSSNLCLVCAPEYYAVKNALSKNASTSEGVSCVACPSQCLLCSYSSIQVQTTSIVQCNLCQPGFLLTNGVCLSCNSPSCSLCSHTNSSQCTVCSDGYYLPQQNGQTSTQCSECPISNCQICNQNQPTIVCTTCFSGYVLNQQNNTCISCPDNCQSCLSPTFCTVCLQSYYLSTSMNGQQQLCNLCPSQCLQCQSQGCIYCSDGFYSNSFTNISYNSTVTIVQCSSCLIVTGCVSCINAQYCTQCSSVGYSTIPTNFGSCTPCPNDCVTCDNNQICSQCQNGYLLNVDTNSCLDETGFPLWAIFGLVIYGVAMICILGQKLRRTIQQKLVKSKVKDTVVEESSHQIQIYKNSNSKNVQTHHQKQSI